MVIKRLSVVLIIFVFFLSIPCLSQTKNRVAVSEADRIKLYEFNSSSLEFDLVWESVEVSLNSYQGRQIQDLHIIDIDNDGDCELIAVDPYGIFIWGKNGQFPLYFPLPGTLANPTHNYILAADIDGDSRMEFLTQRKSIKGMRRISVWRIDSNQLIPLDEIDLPGNISWSLRHGDFDGDGKTEILTSSKLIHILGWKDGEGLVIEAEIANAAQLIDVVRPADIDGDGIDEIIASGNSGCFSVYKHRKIHGKDFYPLYFQSLIEPRDRHSNSQGLHFADIDGDGKKEILVGMTSRRGVNSDNILVYKGFLSSGQHGSDLQFEKVFSMPHRISGIPGFIVGDVDNDGQNEVIYNRKYVLKFHKDGDGKMSSESMGEISQRAWGVAIGPFYPTGENTHMGPRFDLKAVTIDLGEGEFIEPNEKYQIKVKMKSTWQDVSNTRVYLAGDSDVVEIEPKSVSFDTIGIGQEVENTEHPFILRTKNVDIQTSFGLKLIIEAEGGFRVEYKDIPLRTKNSNRFYPFVQPKLKKNSATLAISSGEGRYAGLGINPEYFNDYEGAFWPSSDDLNSYKNLILYDEWSFALSLHQEKLISFLDNGGNCLMHGYYMIPNWVAGFEPPNIKESADILSKYLQVRYLDETNQVKGLKGQAGDIITDGLNFDLKIEQEGYLPGVWEPLASAIPILFYPDGQVAGIRIDGPYKMVILAFYLNDIESVEVRKKLLQRIMDWFDQE